MDQKETPAGINGPKNDQVSNNISSQKVMAAQPTISPAKKLLQLNQQYLQQKNRGISGPKNDQVSNYFLKNVQKVFAI